MLTVFCALALQAGAQNTAPALDKHIEAARLAQARQDCHAAAQEYGAAVKLSPSSAELRADYGIALYCDNRFAEAIPVLQKALELKPALTVPHLFLGLSAYHLGDHAVARRELEKTVALMPSDPNAPLFLGYVYIAEHRLEDAIAQFDATLRLQPQNVEATYALGEAYLEIGRRKATELQKLAPGGEGISRLAAEQTSMRKGEQQTPTTTPSPLPPDQARLYEQARTAELKAADLFQKVIDTAPSSGQAHMILGDEYSAQRQNAEAVTEYRQALAQDPSLPGLRLAMANCLMQLDQSAEALDVLQAEKARRPQSAEVWTALGRVQLSRGEDANALQSLRQAIALPQTPPAAYLLLGRALLRAHDAGAAVSMLQQALAKGAEPSTANYLLARAYRVTGDLDASNRAIAAYRRESLDEKERQAATRLADPKAVPQDLSNEDEGSAATGAPPHS